MMKPFLEKVVDTVLRWMNGQQTEAPGTAPLLVTLPGIGPISRVRLNRSMVLLRNIFIALLLIQCLRAGAAIVQGKLLLRAMKVEEQQAPDSKMRESIETYHPILEKGLLGAVPKEMPQQLLGILGNKALFGTGPENAQEFAVGAEIPGGGKILAIHSGGVDVEKDGETSTRNVFPEMKKQPK